ncbi:hypothetical protein ALC60_02991 [Trachymyrmex zeteki]|uniref:Uncharacterized protein n=1 Tax=Mycetomoellerius zeteki TaxID=64791 RepID=A0A151XC44_9HYME|nr:hypothetical protein ALC60_02991 [Trachymyrmex zeteki]
MTESHFANVHNFYCMQNRDSSYDECSSDNCLDKKWDRWRDLNKSKAPKTWEQNKSEDSAGMATDNFYARQVCCRECG